MNDISAINSRVNDVEQKIHTLEHRTLSIEKSIEGVPARILLIEHQLTQLMHLERKIDKQADSLDSLKQVVLENGYAFKRYAACISCAGAVIMFVISYGDKILRMLGKGIM